jgi:hypothetical protein
MRTIPKENYLKVAQLFDWAGSEHYRVWFTGSRARHRRTEVMLPRLVKKGKLRVEKYGLKNIYIAPKFKKRPNIENIEHGLGVTEGLVRFYRADPTGEIIPSRFFRGAWNVPEWGIKYGEKILLYEFCTRSNFYTRLKRKVKTYPYSMTKIEDKFGAALVLFVCDVEREYVLNFLKRNQVDDPFLFTDYQTFKSVPIGEQLTAPIYFWWDGQKYPLRRSHA